MLIGFTILLTIGCLVSKTVRSWFYFPVRVFLYFITFLFILGLIQ